MCEPITRPINLDRALTAVEEAQDHFDDHDTHDRIRWTPAESLSEKQFSCAIATVEQLRAILQPALKSPITRATHSAHPPYRSILEYIDGEKNTRHIVISQDFISDHGTPKACSINYRLAYYFAAALGSAHAPIFANNSFDASVAAYIKCRAQEPDLLNCGNILGELTFREKDSLLEYPWLADTCENWLKNSPGYLKGPQNCIKFYREAFEEARSFILQTLEMHGGLTGVRRDILRSELQKVPISLNEIKTHQDAIDGLSDVRHALSALFQTTAGRYYFWELRTQLDLRCKNVTTPEQCAAAPNIATVECGYIGYTVRRNFEVTPKQFYYEDDNGDLKPFPHQCSK